MAKKRKKKKTKRQSFALLTLKHVLLLPWHLFRGIRYLVRLSKEETNIRTQKRKKRNVLATNKEFELIQGEKEEYTKWKKELLKRDSSMGIILGARGTGKSAIGLRLLENIYAQTKKPCYTMGFENAALPKWIKNVETTNDIPNNSFVLIDEGGILFSSRKSMSNANKLLSELILIARHKNISILFISQNSSNLEINVLRQADFLLLKPSSLLQKDFERNSIKKIYNETAKEFKKLRETTGITYLYSDQFQGFIANKLPTFWDETVSKSFR